MIKVFLVDDDRWILKGLRTIVNWEEYGFYVIGEETNGLAAYDRIAELQPDVVFTDIIMPGLSGLELLNRIITSGYKIEVVIISSYAEFSYAQQACRLNAFDYLLKPLDKAALGDILERIRQKYAVINDKDIQQLNCFIAPNEIKNDTLKSIVAYINENISMNIRLYDVANHFFFNSCYISNLFKKELGLSFSEYILQIRLKMAEKLIKQGNMPLKAISQKIGFDDYYYFNKFIKKYLGYSPKQMR